MTTYKTLFQNDSYEIVEVNSKSRNGKKLRTWYVNFGYRNGLPCIWDFYKISELKDFIKSKNIQMYFSNKFLKTV